MSAYLIDVINITIKPFYCNELQKKTFINKILLIPTLYSVLTYYTSCDIKIKY